MTPIIELPVSEQRAAVAQEALAWLGTPYHHHARIKGVGVDCAQIDRDNIPGAALDALIAQQAGEPWQQTWVLADNTTATLDAAGMIAVGRALKAAISTSWAAGESERTQIYAAQSQQELDTLSWPSASP